VCLMSDETKAERQPQNRAIDFLVIVDNESRLPIPYAFVERFGIEPGDSVIFLDSGNDVEFIVRVLRSSYAGALAGTFGTTYENVAYVRTERAAWDVVNQGAESAALNELTLQFIYSQLLGDLTRHFGSFRNARLWFETRQPSLDNRTPLDVIEIGKQEAVIGLVHMITSLSRD
jgi:bifunctional DNA-binding transcriptional regulator/antitoxin component of YhaV-PrlF toxin-antitoxin module